MGIAANTELAEEAELDVNNGIVVNEFCLTSEPDIYAAGDVTSHFNPLLGKHIRLESWQCAQNMAIAAAKNMCGQNTPYAEIPWMWSDQFDNNLQVAGLPKSWNNIILHGDSSSGSFIGFILENDIISGAISVNKPRDLRLARRIMSAQKTLTMEELKDEKFSLQELLKR